MVKLDYDRDYYADLELPGTADAVEVKKQFKKLALKWHPDRNPGKEDEAKEKFLVIQAAHEILTDPATKSKLDSYRDRQRTSRYTGASGVRGNPWQYAAHEVNQKYGAPPRRPQMPTRPPAPTAAASTKQWDWAKKGGKPPTENTRAHTEAWAHARPHNSKPSQASAAAAGASARPPKPPPREPPTPRTTSQARRQEAAFGNRKTGYAPASPMGDEPPVRNPHYNTNPNDTQASKPRPTSAFVDPLSALFSETFLDNRQRTPYAANVGEKTNPFEPLNVNRAKSMRDGARRFQEGVGEVPPSPPPRQRSASTGSENFKRSTNEKPGSNEQSPKPGFQYQSRASAQYSPRGPETSSAPPTATFPGPNSSSSSVNSSANGKWHGHSCEVRFTNGLSTATVNGDASDQTRNGSKVYESPFSINPRNLSTIYSAGSSPKTPHSSGRAGVGSARANKFDFPAYKSQENVGPTPSGEGPSPGANLFETKLQAQLQYLLRGARPPAYTTMPPRKTDHWTSKYTNGAYPNSFSVPVDDGPNAPHQARFTRNSADNINTRFVAEEKGGANFQFSAGAAGAADDGFLRAKQRARGHQSPLRNEFTASAETVNGAQQAEPAKKQGDFVPEQWSEAFGPHVFVPPQPGKPTTSPTRPIRPIKRSRPVRMTAGTAGMVDDEETSGEDKGKASTPASGINGSRSPNAMDIDTPPPEPADAQANMPRNIPVEPTKPEWRPGNGVNGEPKLGTGLKTPNLHPTTAGSEDADDFARPMFSEFRNVEPFAPAKPAGLGSFADLSSNLPFASRASAKIPLAAHQHHLHSSEKHAHTHTKPLDIPTPPTAPRAPASLCIPGAKVGAPAWLTYVREFEAYMALWFEFNRRVTDHFAARQRQNEGNGLAWLNAQGEAGVGEYLRAVEMDKYVRQKWMAACEAHELHFREFLGVRERVLAG
ncbi:hypothetical protein C8A01DRAFT_45973 [Parachaetomium inaequale]|uniref:J domain-containing protein n=1 Tax=Parachaetomium inaequale TaxID=2588326 RepID=A0AAN6PKG6_9PEZI|nr:hypothetical protein C8A01DRAFT_45973 [Parachaetomium inaequale]